jgi:hypothetical protein
LRIRPVGLAGGASDPGGLAWLWSMVVTILVILLLSG